MSIKELKKNEKYKIIVPVAYIGNQRKNHYETFYGCRKDALLRESEIKAQIRNNTYILKTKMTISDLLSEWLNYSKDIWSPKNYSVNVIWCNIINKVIRTYSAKKPKCKNIRKFL